MKFIRIICFISIFITYSITCVYAQVAVNTTGAAPDSSSSLDVSSTDKGFLMTRMTMQQRIAIVSPATGLIVFQTDDYKGFYYYDGTRWLLIAASEPQVWTQTWQVYGEMYENNTAGTVIDLPIANVWHGWVSATAGDFPTSGLVYFQNDSNGDKIVIGSGGEGTYLINVSVSFIGTNYNNVNGAIHLNGILQPELRYVTSLSGNDRDSASLSGIITLDTNDYIHFSFSSETDNNIVELYYMNISITRISL